MPKTETKDARDLIVQHLRKPEVDRRITWLAKQTGLTYGHLYHVLVKKERDLTTENKEIINRILGTQF